MKVGDLVVVVKPLPCCGNATAVGSVIFRITSLEDGGSYCVYCGFMHPGFVAGGYRQHLMSTFRLKVIPPLNELEAEKAVETV